MFVPYSFASINDPAQLRRGVYRAEVAFHAGQPHEPRVTMVFYFHACDHEPSALDLIVMEADGSVRVRDYLWQADRSWRDSAGGVANHLAELLPPEILTLPTVGSDRWPDIHLEEVSAL